MTAEIPQNVMDDILKIRDVGNCNMLDFNCVQVQANAEEMHELVSWMEDNKKEWGCIIMGDVKIV